MQLIKRNRSILMGIFSLIITMVILSYITPAYSQVFIHPNFFRAAFNQIAANFQYHSMIVHQKALFICSRNSFMNYQNAHRMAYCQHLNQLAFQLQTAYLQNVQQPEYTIYPFNASPEETLKKLKFKSDRGDLNARRELGSYCIYLKELIKLYKETARDRSNISSGSPVMQSICNYYSFEAQEKAEILERLLAKYSR